MHASCGERDRSQIRRRNLSAWDPGSCLCLCPSPVQISHASDMRPYVMLYNDAAQASNGEVRASPVGHQRGHNALQVVLGVET